MDEDGAVARVGGTALGGGTLRGLGRLLLGTDDHDRLVALAATGDRRHVDLLVGDLYRPGGIALVPDLTAANFGKAFEPRAADVAHALLGLVGENVALLAGQIAVALASSADGGTPRRQARRPLRGLHAPQQPPPRRDPRGRDGPRRGAGLLPPARRVHRRPRRPGARPARRLTPRARGARLRGWTHRRSSPSPLLDLEGRVALVTGASRGIGAATARLLGRCNARVAIHYGKSRAEAEEVASDIARAGRTSGRPSSRPSSAATTSAAASTARSSRPSATRCSSSTTPAST